VAFPSMLLVGIVEAMTFIAVLAIGYIYAWRKHALEWR
jgi:NADH:ubiquinone oxidoreductase subunit 3 (subunit A)